MNSRPQMPTGPEAWDYMQHRAAIAPIGTKRQRERDLKIFTTLMLKQELKEKTK